LNKKENELQLKKSNTTLAPHDLNNLKHLTKEQDFNNLARPRSTTLTRKSTKLDFFKSQIK